MFIQNVSRSAVESGFHLRVNPCKSMLIQISDVDAEFPIPKYDFSEVHQFKFDDAEDPSDGTIITKNQANEIAELLKKAFDSGMDVVVHCHAGICRSGAVCEVGVMMGFQDGGTKRIPNMLVKHSIMRALGWYYE